MQAPQLRHPDHFDTARGAAVTHEGVPLSVPANPARLAFLEWSWFALQLLAIAALEFAEDIFRGEIDPPNPHEAIRHALEVVAFEQAHGLFIEPALQLWIRHAHALFGLLSYANVVHVTDTIYALGQTLVPLLVAIWIYARHRSHFAFARNVTLLSTLFALIGYELFPMAPPRLTTGLSYSHHAFHFRDTVQHLIGDGKLGGTSFGYNAYAAMPSLHFAWALIVAVSVLLLTNTMLIRLLASLYPVVMLYTVMVSANHYLMDTVGATVVVALACMLALILEPDHAHLSHVPSRFRGASNTGVRPQRMLRNERSS